MKIFRGMEEDVFISFSEAVLTDNPFNDCEMVISWEERSSSIQEQ
jgi:hypothetical protein